ncbi:MAG: ATP-binding protein [Saprospiraceae bacterium]|nr:ATP-binding protein [Saprospiraceae bacterium]
MKAITFFVRISFLLLGFCFLSFGASAQKADSIYQAIQQIDDPLDKIKEGVRGARELVFLDKDTAMLLAQKAMASATNLGEPYWVGRAQNEIGQIFFYRDKYDEALEWKQKAFDGMIAIDSMEIAGLISGEMAHINTYKNDYIQALRYVNQSLDIFRDLGLDVRQAQVGITLGYTLQLLQEYEDAEKAYQEANEILRADSLKNLASYQMSNYYLGELYVESKQPRKAVPLLIKFTEYLKGLDATNEYMEFVTQKTLGAAYVQVDQNKDGLLLCNQALKVGQPIGELAGSSDCYHCLAEGHLNLGQLDSAEYHGLKALEIARDIKSMERQVKATSVLAKVYEAKQDYEKSLQYIKENKVLGDSLFDIKKTQQFARLQMEKSIEAQARENNLLKANLENANLRAALLGGGILLLLVVAFLIFRSYRTNLNYSKELEDKVTERTAELNDSNHSLVTANDQLHRLNTDLHQLNTELQQFAYVTSHDLKEPIKNILGFSDMIQRKLEGQNGPATDVKNYVKYIAKGAKRMSSLVEAVTNYTTINKGGEDVHRVDLNEIMDEVTDILYNRIQEKEARIHYGGLPSVIVSESNILVVFKNLIENAIKYNDSNPPIIYVDYEELPNLHRITIRDNGIGVEPKYEDYIFELFRRLNPKASEGTGLGLAISKKIIQGMGGTIGLDKSYTEKGSAFYFTLPK